MTGGIALPALGIVGPGGGGGATINPFEALGTIANIGRTQAETSQINQMMQQRQLQLNGYQRFSDILAQAPSTEEGYAAALRDPIAGAYAGEALDKMGSALVSQRNIDVSVATEAKNGLQSFWRAAVASGGDPDQFNQRLDEINSTLSPAAQKQDAFALGRLRTAMTDGMPQGNDPQSQALRQQMMNKRLIGLGISADMDPDKLRNIMGVPASQLTTVRTASGAEIPGAFMSPLGGQPYLQAYPTAHVGPTAPSTAAAEGPLTTTPPATGAPGTDQVVPAPGEEPTTTAPGARPVADTGMATGLQPPSGEIPLGQTTEEKATAEKQAQAQVESEKDVQDEISGEMKTFNPMVQRMDMLQDTMGGFLSGPGSSAGTRAQEWLRAAARWSGTSAGQEAMKAAGLGSVNSATAEQWINGWKNTDTLPAAQEFRALIRSYAVQQLKEAAQGTGRVMLPEVQAFMDAISPDMDPRAIMDMINSGGRQALQVAYDRAQKWPVYRQMVAEGKQPAGMKIGDFYNWYSANQPPNDMLPTVNEAGRKFGPRPPWEAMGVARPTGGGYIYNPNATGGNTLTGGPPPGSQNAPNATGAPLMTR